MSELMRLDDEYRRWIQELGDKYRNSQIKAAIKVNNEMLLLYWHVGKEISEKYSESKWGSKFFNNMSMDLVDLIPNAKGFSPSNLRYMMCFYNEFKDIVIVPQVGEQLLENAGNEITQTIGLLICKTKDNILAKYAVETSTEPIGISEYELNALMPKDFKGTLPTIEELEKGLAIDAGT